MEKLNVKIFCFLIAALALTSLVYVASAQMQENQFNAGNYVCYTESDDNRFLLLGDKANSSGVSIILHEALLDVIRHSFKDTSKIMVKDLKKVKLYKLNEEYSKIKEFWNKYTHSDVLVKTPNAEVLCKNQTQPELVRGEDEIRFRSPMLDLDGVGFYFDVKNSFIHIKSKVRVVLRPNMDREMVIEDTNKKKTGEKNEK